MRLVGKHGFVLSLVYFTLVAVGLFVVGAWSNHSLAHWYLLWNLCLAWVPLLAAWLLVRLLKKNAWSGWKGVTCTVVWLGFLPNSFYLVSDMIHLQDYQRVDIVYDTAMFAAFMISGLLIGFTSLQVVHTELAKRVRATTAWIWVSLVLLLCSYAIYLGRESRWNTWDILLSPAGVLFDISDQIVNPTAHSLAFTTTLTFFVLLSSLYVVAYQILREGRWLRSSKS